MPSILSILSSESVGINSTGARNSAELKEPRRKLPEIPIIVVIRERMVKLSSSGHSQNDAEPHSSAVHLFVAFGHLIKWILLDYRMNTAQRAEFQGVLRILRGARIPTRD